MLFETNFTMQKHAANSLTSHWVLPADGVRQITPPFVLNRLMSHTLSRDLYILAMGYYPRALGHNMQRTKHDTYLLLYCVAGEGMVECAGIKQSVGRGDLVLLPPGQSHNYSAHEDNPWSIYWVHFEGELIDDVLGFAKLSTGLNHLGVHPNLMVEFERLLSFRRSERALSGYIFAANIFRALLIQIGSLHRSVKTLSGHDTKIDAVKEYMQHHLDRELNLAGLAEMANLSKYYFTRRFKEQTGQTPIQYFIFLKMERACQLLDTTQASIKSIAADLGFSDSLYFSRQFNKVMGVSPQTYRDSPKA